MVCILSYLSARHYFVVVFASCLLEAAGKFHLGGEHWSPICPEGQYLIFFCFFISSVTRSGVFDGMSSCRG